jgi:hypothetical protein
MLCKNTVSSFVYDYECYASYKKLIEREEEKKQSNE